MWHNARGRLFVNKTLSLDVVSETVLKSSIPIISDIQELFRTSTQPEIAVGTHFYIKSNQSKIAVGTLLWTI